MRTSRATLRAVLPLLLLSVLVASCGNEPPAPGEITVTSSPPGALITLDGHESGQTTPYTFPELEGGNYVVSVTMEGWTTFPSERSVDLPYGASITADFLLSQDVGALTVTSTPAGATILIDGEDSGEVTPHTFSAWPAGTHVVAVQLDNYVSQPQTQEVDLAVGGAAAADFTLIQLQVPRVVLIEGFSNVYCSGCPTFNANVGFVMSQEGHGFERLVYVKWPAYQSRLDPFFRQTEDITDARVTYYYGTDATSLPTAQGDGVLLGSLLAPPNAAGLAEFVDNEPEFANVRVDVSTTEDLTDIDDLTHDAQVSLMAPGGLDLTGYVLHVVLLYDEVTTERDYPVGNGSEFHWVMRDHVVASSNIGVLNSLETRSFAVTLTDPLTQIPGHAIYPEGKQIVAFIQHATEKTVIQVGSTMMTAPSPATELAAGRAVVPLSPLAHPGGSR